MATVTKQFYSVAYSDRLISSNSFGINVNDIDSTVNGVVKRTQSLITYGITCEWDETRHMYHIHGTATGTAMLNICVKSNSLPDGMVTGKRYWGYVESDCSLNSEKKIALQFYYSTDGTNWTRLTEDIYINDKIFSLILPSTAVGLLARFYTLAGSTVDLYARVNISNNVFAMPEFSNKYALLCLDTNLGFYTALYPNSCDDVSFNSVFFNSYDSSLSPPHTILDFPFNGPGWLLTYITSNNTLAYQTAISYENGSLLYRIKKFTGWTDWSNIGGGGQQGNIYNNTYNITTSPSITTDSNGWLQAVDNESTLESNATDMSGAILSMLNSTGYCHLGPGVFYVSGNIDMPDGSLIEGCGSDTVIRLLSSVSSGYILRIKQYNTVKDIHFSGGSSIPDNLYTDGTNMGFRHGIYMIANADGNELSQPATAQCLITNCYFDNFDGSAFYAHNTGGGLHNSVVFSDSHIEHCRVGLNIDYYNEYAKYANLVIFQCYYACINNGGNNIFVACTFHGVVGWLTDNTNNDKSNNQHGSCIGCTFNHIDNMNNPTVLGNGWAVHIINGVAGFIFTGCQFWYGNINIENSLGIQFSDNLFGNNAIVIDVTGSYPAFFFNNIFWTQPTLNVISSCKFDKNYIKSGTEVSI